jgi:hypothetical protein
MMKESISLSAESHPGKTDNSMAHQLRISADFSRKFPARNRSFAEPCGDG